MNKYYCLRYKGLRQQNIEFSDFSMDLFKVYLVDKIILLPTEN